ncbi:hypothetical protein F2Q69_00049134 [Brassica cretica]|uniref:Uncharacterized protein n=1 Tax=Brassica cretica TaxID=69181 RepID=A0A8S9PV30_BRACR|nr:hypothetical protein F2Q69_00049134 [Brassica cretica]
MMIGRVEELERPTGARATYRSELRHPLANFEAGAGSGSDLSNPRSIWRNEAESQSDLSERGETPTLEAERLGGATSSTRARFFSSDRKFMFYLGLSGC